MATLTGKMNSALSATKAGLAEGSTWTAWQTAATAALGIATIGIYKMAFGEYEGHIVDQAIDAFINQIPYWSARDAWEVFKEDLVGGGIGYVVGAAGMLKRSADAKMAQNYAEAQESEKPRDDIRETTKTHKLNNSHEVIRSTSDIRRDSKIKNLSMQRSPTSAD